MNRIKEQEIMSRIKDAETLINIGYKMIQDIRKECDAMNVTMEIHTKVYSDKQSHWF